MTRVRIGVALCAVLLLPSLGAAEESADLARGETLFRNCVQCHGEQGQGNPLALAPGIGGLKAWYVVAQVTKFQDGIRGAHPDDRAGMRMLPMARLLRNEADLNAVAAYIETLPPANPTPSLSGGDPERGKALYATCAACHMADGTGMQAVNGPSLVYTNDWYLYTTMQKYKAGARGGNPKDVNGALMRSMSNTLVDDQAIKDVVAYIMTLRKP